MGSIVRNMTSVIGYCYFVSAAVISSGIKFKKQADKKDLNASLIFLQQLLTNCNSSS